MKSNSIKEEQILETIWKKEEPNGTMWRIVSIKGYRDYAVGYEERFKSLYTKDRIFFLSFTNDVKRIKETSFYLPYPHEMQELMLDKVLDIVIKPNIRKKDILKFQKILNVQKLKTEIIQKQRNKIIKGDN